MPTLKKLEEEIERVKARNSRVEKDKKWETSWTRRAAITLATYIVVLLFFLVIGTNKPFESALVPSIGFLLSTLTIDFLKSRWLKHN